MAALSSCSTKKDKWNRRVFHNLTGHYNAYYNGNESLKEGIRNVKLAHEDDYTEILQIFPLSVKDKAQQSSPQFDRAVTKASIVIHNHSMYFNSREKVKWVYYSFLMIGKAQFYKHDYTQAKMTFKYILTKYSKEEVKTDAMLWLALIASIEGNYQEATSNLDAIRNKAAAGETSDEVLRMIPMVYADVYLRQKNYAPAIPHLKQAIENNKKKAVKSRLTFILAQVYQHENNCKLGTQTYQKVLKMNPPYQMDFNARMNMAKCYQGGTAGKEIKALVFKMLKDSKNKEFQDQIYYVLAQIELKEKNVPKAIEYLKLSVQTSVNNNKQKAFSAMELGEIYFKSQDYTPAQAYYDSTVLFLPKDYVDYSKIEERRNILTELVKHLVVVQREDSLQRIAGMSENERIKFIDKLITAEVELERKQQEEEQLRQIQIAQSIENNNGLKSVTQQGAATWYFYNSTTLNYGINEFKAKWGTRQLEDNWRLSNKELKMETQTVKNDEDEGDQEGSDGDSKGNTKGQKQALNKKSREYYLKDLPLTKIKIDSSNARLERAFFGQGVVYKEKLANYDKAIAAFEELLRRFPSTSLAANTYYYLFQLYDQQGMENEADKYKKLLKQQFPESDFSKILNDPDYLTKLAKQSNEVKDAYKLTYELYKAGQCEKVKANVEKAKKTYATDKESMARFDMLNCLCIGKTADTNSFIAALEKHCITYPTSATKELAQNLIANMRNAASATNLTQTSVGKNEVKELVKEVGPEGTPYVYDAKTVHYFVFIVDKKKDRVNDIRVKISDHNMKYFGSENLSFTTIPLVNDIMLLNVSQFASFDDAVNYMRVCRRNIELYELIQGIEGNFFPISESNYTLLFKTKDIDGYKKFLEKYLK